ncbi:unnamed protein product [Fructobacillus fructosus]|uniref:Uncharacterized protein n=2 Tax=Fructobacillus fructosus TaxID=1631 RepID=A0ABN9YRD6_9LACO|nr:unnamed protein product [Fructobacillus fructosus]CAK1252259.1 unnamed protein product [Fructobacillus fructosus]
MPLNLQQIFNFVISYILPIVLLIIIGIILIIFILQVIQLLIAKLFDLFRNPNKFLRLNFTTQDSTHETKIVYIKRSSKNRLAQLQNSYVPGKTLENGITNKIVIKNEPMHYTKLSQRMLHWNTLIFKVTLETKRQQ